MKLYDKNAVAKFLDMTPKNVERLTSKGVLQTVGETKLYSLTEANHAYIRRFAFVSFALSSFRSTASSVSGFRSLKYLI